LLLLSSPQRHRCVVPSHLSFPLSLLSLSHFLFLRQNPNPNRDRNRNIHKQSQAMDGDSSWSARLSSASRRYQSALQSRSGSPSLLPAIQFISPFSSLSPCSTGFLSNRILNCYNLQGYGCGGWIFDSGCIYEEGKLGHNVKNWFFWKLFSWLLLLLLILMVVWWVWIIGTGLEMGISWNWKRN